MNSIVATSGAALGVAEAAVRELRPGNELEAEAATARAFADRVVPDLDGRLMSLFASDDRPRPDTLSCITSGRCPPRRPFCASRRRSIRRALIPVDRREASGGELVRAGSDGLLRSHARGPSESGSASPCTTTGPREPGRCERTFRTIASCRASPGDFHPFRPVTGEGVFQVPVGPVHAGIIEPGHFRFGVAGEPVLYLQLRLFYVHKGTEKRFERLPWRHGLFLAESISGRYGRRACAGVRPRDRAPGGCRRSAARPRAAGGAARARADLQPHRRYRRHCDRRRLHRAGSRAQALRESLVRLHERAVRHAIVARHDRARRCEARSVGRRT